MRDITLKVEVEEKNIVNDKQAKLVSYITGLVLGYNLYSKKDYDALATFREVYTISVCNTSEKSFGLNLLTGEGGSHFWCMDCETKERLFIITMTERQHGN